MFFPRSFGLMPDTRWQMSDIRSQTSDNRCRTADLLPYSSKPAFWNLMSEVCICMRINIHIHISAFRGLNSDVWFAFSKHMRYNKSNKK